MRRRSRHAHGYGLPVIAAAAVVAGGLARAATAEPLKVPHVPFVGQSKALCGGAALAMVMRYWQPVRVVAEDFAAAVDHAAGGIPAGELARQAAMRGFRAFPMASSASAAERHLSKGRPLIVLLSPPRGPGHYVVLLAAANDRVLYHDPAAGPFRVMAAERWREQWARSGNWALLLLPDAAATPGEPIEETVAAPPDRCDGLVLAAVATARSGDLESAGEQLAAATLRCPGSSAPLRETAGLYFLRDEWAAAAQWAERAVAVDPTDANAWRLLATSRFLDGAPEAALDAWNAVGEPRLDLVEVNGLQHLVFADVMARLDTRHGGILTADAVRRARRRLASLPGVWSSRVAFRPQGGGRADLVVAVSESRRLTPMGTVLLRAGALAVSDGALGSDAAAVAAGGVLRLGGRWQPHRWRFLMGVEQAGPIGLPGVLRTEAEWDEQSYRDAAGALVRERRRRLSVELAEWTTADRRISASVGADRFGAREHAQASVGAEQRLWSDRAALSGHVRSWWAAGVAPIRGAAVRLNVRTSTTPGHPLLTGTIHWQGVTSGAPRALWTGAGTGQGRSELLRGHELVRGGVIDATENSPFRRSLLGSSFEADVEVARLGPVRASAALFVDTAHALHGDRRNWVDVGTGVRVRLPGRRGSFRIDLATPADRMQPRLSAGWQGGWESRR